MARQTVIQTRKVCHTQLALGGCLCLSIILCSFFAGCSKPTAAESPVSSSLDRPKTLLIASPQEIDLGVVPRGGKKEAAFTVTNPGTVPVEIASVETSCGCLSIEMSQDTVEPLQEVFGMVKLEMNSEFIGSLSMDVRAYTPNSKKAYELNVCVDVKQTRGISR